MTDKDFWQLGISILAIVLASASLLWQTIQRLQDKRARLRLMEERRAKEELDLITPRHAQFQALAKRHPPPQSWYDEDVEGLY